MGRKLNTNLVKQEAEMYGFVLLEDFVPKKRLKIMCKRGHIQSHYPYYFKNAKCEECSKIEKQISIRKEIESQGYILHNEYESLETKLIMTCHNGHHRECKIESFRYYECESCFSERKLFDLLSNIECQGYKILEYPKDTRGILKAICKNGHTRKAKIYNFINHDCMECKTGRPVKYDIDYVRSAFEERGFLLLEDEYIDCKTELNYICNCGERRRSTFDNILNGDRHYCNLCRGSSFSGENHYNWKGGISSESSKIRSSGEYSQWRKSVFKRDNYTCQCCKKTGGYLHAHHIFNFSDHEDLRLEISNGKTLCKDCHIEFHITYGYNNNNQEQLDEFIHNYFKLRN